MSPTSCASSGRRDGRNRPLRLRDPLLNELATDPISLLAYDAFILESGKEPDDPSRTETAATEPEGDEPADRGDDR
jgi:hypothetical protein